MLKKKKYTVYNQNKAHALINVHPFFGADFKTFHLTPDWSRHFLVNISILSIYFTSSPFIFYTILRLSSDNMGVCLSQVKLFVSDRNNVNFMTYQKLQNYFKKVFKNRAPPKFCHPRMRFILIIHSTYLYIFSYWSKTVYRHDVIDGELQICLRHIYLSTSNGSFTVNDCVCDYGCNCVIFGFIEFL